MKSIRYKDVLEERRRFDTDTELKQYLVNFVGEHKKLKDDEEVTVEMIVEVMAEEFPEFVLSVAEENFLRGYDQAITDIEFFKDLGENDTQECFERKTQ